LLRPLIEYSYPNTPTIERAGRSTFFGRTPRAGPQVVVGADGGLYRTESDEYQVLALAPDGTQRWALRVATTAPPLTREEIDFVMDLVRSRYEDATESEVNLPERQPALMRMMVDGHGHLYVFPYAWEAYGLPIPPPDPIAVDVYAQDGRRLFSGMSPARSWGYAEGDHVWEIAMDPDTEEYVVRKVRLVEPFD
jgi:hypothetical protein